MAGPLVTLWVTLVLCSVRYNVPRLCGTQVAVLDLTGSDSTYGVKLGAIVEPRCPFCAVFFLPRGSQLWAGHLDAYLGSLAVCEMSIGPKPDELWACQQDGANEDAAR